VAGRIGQRPRVDRGGLASGHDGRCRSVGDHALGGFCLGQCGFEIEQRAAQRRIAASPNRARAASGNSEWPKTFMRGGS
jgi:hypothetical protein